MDILLPILYVEEILAETKNALEGNDFLEVFACKDYQEVEY